MRNVITPGSLFETAIEVMSGASWSVPFGTLNVTELAEGATDEVVIRPAPADAVIARRKATTIEKSGPGNFGGRTTTRLRTASPAVKAYERLKNDQPCRYAALETPRPCPRSRPDRC